MRNGKTVNTDGPFAETKEQLGGFYLIKADNLDEAIKVAARIPDAKDGSIEIRPIWEFPAQGLAPDTSGCEGAEMEARTLVRSSFATIAPNAPPSAAA